MGISTFVLTAPSRWTNLCGEASVEVDTDNRRMDGIPNQKVNLWSSVVLACTLRLDDLLRLMYCCP